MVNKKGIRVHYMDWVSRLENKEFPPASQPYDIAVKLAREVFTASTGYPTLKYYQGEFYIYYLDGTNRWCVDNGAKQLTGALYEILNGQPTTSGGVLKATRALVANVLEPLQDLCRDDAPITPNGLIPVANGLLDPISGELYELNPDCFNTYQLGYAYDPTATAPRWAQFLEQVLPDDPNGILCLQEWFGYVLSGDTDMQKAFYLWGASRSGKSTISNVLKALVGEENTSGTAISFMGTDFGLSDLIGKLLNISGDARITKGSEGVNIAQSLLNITGEDHISINRKYKSAWSGQLPTRLMMCSNTLPSFSDKAGVLPTRLLYVHTPISFAGKENPHLYAALIAELPGILNWSLEGYRRLREQDHFTLSVSHVETLEQVTIMANPLKEFLEGYEITGDPTDKITFEEFYKDYKWWCAEQGIEGRIPYQQGLANEVKALAPAVLLRKQKVPKPARVLRCIRKKATRAMSDSAYTA